MTLSRDAFIWPAWPTSYVSRDSLHLCDVTRCHVPHSKPRRGRARYEREQLMFVAWRIRMCNTIHSNVRHDSFVCATWLIRMWHGSWSTGGAHYEQVRIDMTRSNMFCVLGSCMCGTTHGPRVEHLMIQIVVTWLGTYSASLEYALSLTHTHSLTHTRTCTRTRTHTHTRTRCVTGGAHYE